MRPRILVAAAALLVLAGVAGYLAWQDTLVPVPLGSDASLYVPAAPEFGEDQAVLEAQMPAGPGLEAFLANQSDLTVLTTNSQGAWVGQLAEGLQGTRHGRRWRITFKAGVRLQDGATLDATRAEAALATELRAAGAEARVIDGRTLELRFASRRNDLPERLTRWRILGSGPFARKGTDLARFDGFLHGKAGLAGLRVDTDPALMESRAWAQGVVSGRWAWAAYPGHVEPEDMAKVRLAPCDEVRLGDGTVWFVSRKLRRFNPERGPWTATRIFGVWRGSMDLPRAGALE